MTREDVRAIMRREAIVAMVAAVIGCGVTAWYPTPIHPLAVTARGVGAALAVLVGGAALVAGLAALHVRLLNTPWSSRWCVEATTIFGVAFPIIGAIVFVGTITEMMTMRSIMVGTALIIAHTGIMVAATILIGRVSTAFRRRLLDAPRAESS